MKLAFAFCTNNRTDRPAKLVTAMRAQNCLVSFEILAGNNSKYNALAVLEQKAREPGANLRYVTENQQGIVPARNQDLKEVLDNDILVFMNNHELPQEGLLNTAYNAIVNKGRQCTGGRVELDFTTHSHRVWLSNALRWQCDIENARPIFRKVLLARHGSLSAKLRMLPSLLPLSVHRAIAETNERLNF